jgi:ferredoxin
MKVAVDADICGGHGVCWALCPEVFEPHDDGYAVVLAAEVPVEHEVAVRQAAAECPTRAITITS